jgi:hypothetical protein
VIVKPNFNAEDAGDLDIKQGIVMKNYLRCVEGAKFVIIKILTVTI